MEIITGHTGEPHIKPEQDRAVHQGLVGADSCILNVGNNLAAEVISANEIRILDGVLSHQGCFGIVETGTYDTLAIANGAQGMQRKDLIVCRYQKTGNIESLSFVVIQGTAAASNPASPAYNTGLIANGDSPVDVPLYRVNIDGITITSIDSLVDVIGLAGDITALQNKIGTTSMGTTATTLTGAIREHETDITALQGTVNNQLFKTRLLTWDNISINADWYYQNLAYNATLSGYKAIGIIGFGAYPATSGGVNANWCLFQKCLISTSGANDLLDIYVWNQNKSAAAKVKIYVRVLYVKTGLVS